MNRVQAQSLPSELVTKVLGEDVYVGPIVTIEPRRRKFHKPITVTLPLPWELQTSSAKYSISSLRLLCSIAGNYSPTVMMMMVTVVVLQIVLNH